MTDLEQEVILVGYKGAVVKTYFVSVDVYDSVPSTWHAKQSHIYPKDPKERFWDLKEGQPVITCGSVTMYKQFDNVYYGSNNQFYVLVVPDAGFYYCPYIPVLDINRINTPYDFQGV